MLADSYPAGCNNSAQRNSLPKLSLSVGEDGIHGLHLLVECRERIGGLLKFYSPATWLTVASRGARSGGGVVPSLCQAMNLG